MNRTRTLFLAALAAPALCSTIAPGDSLAFRPAAGTQISRAWSIKQDLTLDEMNMTMNGQPLPMDIQMDMDMTSETSVEVSDVIVSVEGGRPVELRRTFDKLGSSGNFSVEMPQMPDGGMEQSITGASKLQGKTVKFKWSDEQGEFEPSYHESEGEADMLEGLHEDMDLRGLLPGKDVAAGDTWEIDVKGLRPLLMPGGDVGIRPENQDQEMSGMMPGMDGMGDMSDMLGDMLEGEATAEYQGIQDVEGGKYGVIKLKINIASNNDMADKLAEMAKEMPNGMGEMKFDHIDVEFGVEAEGTVLWDVAAGHIRKVDLTGKVKMNMDTAMQISAEGRNMAFEQAMAMSGTIAIQLDVTKN